MKKRSGRRKPVGWRNHSDEHALASRGIKTRYEDKIDRRAEAERREITVRRGMDGFKEVVTLSDGVHRITIPKQLYQELGDMDTDDPRYNEEEGLTYYSDEEIYENLREWSSELFEVDE